MPAAARDPALYRKLFWLALFRVLTITVLLGGTAMVSWDTRGEAERLLAPVYGIIIVSYLASIGFALALRRRVGLVPTAYGQIVLDVGVSAGLVAVTGRSESIFVFLFSLAVVNASILLYRAGALTAIALSIPAYLAVTVAQRPFPAATVFAHAGAFVATAILSAYLAEQLRSTGEQLAARESDLEALTAVHTAVVQSMTGGLLTLDPGGRVTFLNRAGEQMTGIPLETVRGRPAREAFPMFGSRVARDEVELLNPRGERLQLGYSSFPLMDRAGELMGTAVTFQDLTQLRAMEETVKRAERLADLGRLAAGLAHELRNPMASMCGSIELLREQGGVEERRLIDIALREAERLNVLVTEFLRFARPPPLHRERVDLSVLIGETLEVFAQDPVASAVRVERDLRPTVLQCDPAQIRQVVWNLLLNAAQALADRPDRRIRVENRTVDGGAVTLSVQDNGPGVPREELSRIFLPFHTTKPGGTGLGLATVQRIVDAHQGRITVESTPGVGTSFGVRLPVAAPADGAAG